MTNPIAQLFNNTNLSSSDTKLFDPKAIFTGWTVFLFVAEATREFLAHQNCSGGRCLVIHVGPFPDWYMLWVPFAFLGLWIKSWQGKTITTLALGAEFYNFFFTRQYRVIYIYSGDIDIGFSWKKLFDLQFLAACCLTTFILLSFAKKVCCRK